MDTETECHEDTFNNKITVQRGNQNMRIGLYDHRRAIIRGIEGSFRQTQNWWMNLSGNSNSVSSCATVTAPADTTSRNYWVGWP